METPSRSRTVLVLAGLAALTLLAAGAVVSVREDSQGGLRFSTVFAGRKRDLWEHYAKIQEEALRELIEHLQTLPADLRYLSDEDVRKILEALWKVEQLPAEFN